MLAGLNFVNHTSQRSLPGDINRDRRMLKSLQSFLTFITDIDADCLFNCYMQGLMAIDWMLLITAVCDYLAGWY